MIVTHAERQDSQAVFENTDLTILDWNEAVYYKSPCCRTSCFENIDL